MDGFIEADSPPECLGFDSDVDCDIVPAPDARQEDLSFEWAGWGDGGGIVFINVIRGRVDGRIENIHGHFKISESEEGTVLERIPYRAYDEGGSRAKGSAEKGYSAGPLFPLRQGLHLDIYFLYTAAARQQRAIPSNPLQIEDNIVSSMASVNNIFAIPGPGLKPVQLVGIEEIGYIEDAPNQNGDLGNDLFWLQNFNNTQVRSIREAKTADLVCLIVADGGVINPMFTGLATTLLDPVDGSGSFYDRGFCVINADDANDASLYAHEIGHMLGGYHNEENAPNLPQLNVNNDDRYPHVASGTFSNGNTYRFSTIMGSSLTSGPGVDADCLDSNGQYACTRFSVFSTLDYTADQLNAGANPDPMGNAIHNHDADLEVTARYVAGFYERPDLVFEDGFE